MKDKIKKVFRKIIKETPSRLSTKALKRANKIKKLKNQGNSERTYFHDVLGYNYRMTNIQAAIGIGQLDKVDKIYVDKEPRAWEKPSDHTPIVLEIIIW